MNLASLRVPPIYSNMTATVKRLITMITFLATVASLSAQYTKEYIKKYTPTVISEMERTGIPASIKMAQAVLESGSGRSTLARQSNNHFGIKCGKNWTGGEVYREDDDYKDGLLIRSCFRAYDDPSSSFIAHSEFLMKNRRYATLWEIPRDDYEGWAYGLKKAGYATDPNYPQKLINVIEKYELYYLDQGAPVINDPQLVVHETSTNIQKGHRSPTTVIKVDRPHYAIKDGYYTMQPGDDLLDIAAHYNMTLKELAFRNRLSYGEVPAPGEKLAISHYIHFKKRPKTVEQLPQKYLFEEKITLSSL